METTNERRSTIAAMTHVEIEAVKNRVRIEVVKAEELREIGTIIIPECPFCGRKMFRTLKPYPVAHLVWQCNEYLKNEGEMWWATNQPCGLTVQVSGGKMDFGFGGEYIL